MVVIAVVVAVVVVLVVELVDSFYSYGLLLAEEVVEELAEAEALVVAVGMDHYYSSSCVVVVVDP